MLSQLRTEEGLVRAGLDGRIAVRVAPYLTGLGLHVAAHDGTPAALDGTLAALDADALRALDGPTLHALAITLTALASRDRRFASPLIAVWRELTSGSGAAYVRGLVERAEIPMSRREAIPSRLAAQAIRGIALDDGSGGLALLRLVAEGDDLFADAARVAVTARVASAHRSLEALLAEAKALGPDEAPPCFVRMCAEDTRLGGERELRRRIVTAWLGVAWPIYTERRWDLLRRLLASIDGVVEAMALELEADPSELAYRAAVAQVLVFRSEMAPTLSAQVALGERAHALCPTLRNGRVVLAAHLAHRAGSDRSRESRERDAHRALALDPYQRRAREILGRE